VPGHAVRPVCPSARLAVWPYARLAGVSGLPARNDPPGVPTRATPASPISTSPRAASHNTVRWVPVPCAAQ